MRKYGNRGIDPPASGARAAFGAVRGLTLLEMMVVLVLVSLLGTLLVQGASFFFGKYAAVKRVHRDLSLTALHRHWFVSTVQAMAPSRREARRFVGDAFSFEGVTLQSLGGEPGMPVRARWSVGGEEGSKVVAYAEGGGAPWTVLALDGEAPTFQYADSAGQWRDRWPIADDAPRNPAWEAIPRMVRLVSEAGRTVWLAHLDLFPEPVPNYQEDL